MFLCGMHARGPELSVCRSRSIGCDEQTVVGALFVCVL